MADIDLVSVSPREAIEHFRRKGYAIGFDWRDIDAATHARAFTVAKGMNLSILKDIREAVDAAIADGQTFRQFYSDLAPKLQEQGWWGKRELVDPQTGAPRVVQLGSPRRLQIIFDTNIRTAYAKGHWERIERLKDRLPFLRYSAVDDARTRPEHLAWHGIVLPVDHPWWRTHFPPNGWRCRCTSMQLDRSDLDRYGYTVSESPADRTFEWTNKRTGEIQQVPVGIDPGFAHNVGLLDLQTLAREQAARNV